MFRITSLTAKINDKTVLNDFNLDIDDGTIHVIMGKNGIGKSTLCKIILHDQDYRIINGEILYNNKNILNEETYEVARDGIFLVTQNPISVEGVSNAELLRTALREIKNENINIFEFNKELENACEKLELDKDFIHREVNVGASGGEKKKVELLHMALLKPSFIILDEIDSGLDVDSLKTVCNFINEYHKTSKCSILIITHHPNIVEYIKPNYVHILDNGKIVKTGDYHLAYDVEKLGYLKVGQDE